MKVEVRVLGARSTKFVAELDGKPVELLIGAQHVLDAKESLVLREVEAKPPVVPAPVVNVSGDVHV